MLNRNPAHRKQTRMTQAQPKPMTIAEMRAMLDENMAEAEDEQLRLKEAREARPPQSANSLVALENHRERTQFGGPGARTCAKEGCGAIAVRDFPLCRHHGGAAVLAIRARAQGKPAAGMNPARVARSNVAKLMRRQAIPQELLQQDVFQAVGRIALPHWFGERLALEWTPGERYNARLLIRELVVGWLTLTSGDFEPWGAAVRKAIEHKFFTPR